MLDYIALSGFWSDYEVCDEQCINGDYVPPVDHEVGYWDSWGNLRTENDLLKMGSSEQLIVLLMGVADLTEITIVRAMRKEK